MGLGPPAQTETPTQEPPASLPETSAPPAGTLEPPPKPAPSDTPPPGEPEGGQPEGEEGKPETPASPWASATDLDGLMAVEQVAAHVEERETASFDRGRSETQSRMQPKLDGLERTWAEINRSTSDFIQSWNDAVEGGQLSADDAKRLIRNHRDAFAALSGAQLTVGFWNGVDKVIEQTGGRLGDKATGFRQRVTNMQNGLSDPTFMDDYVDALADAKAKPVREQLKEANAHIQRLELEAKTSKRTEQSPPANTSGRTGGASQGGDPSAVLRDPNATPEQKSEAFRRKHGIDPT